MTLHARETVRSSVERLRVRRRRPGLGAAQGPVSQGARAGAQDVFEAIRDELLLDGNSRQNLATFCQTWEEPQVHELMNLAIDKNMIDKDEYPQSAELERRCVHLLADLWNAPGVR